MASCTSMPTTRTTAGNSSSSMIHTSSTSSPTGQTNTDDSYYYNASASTTRLFPLQTALSKDDSIISSSNSSSSFSNSFSSGYAHLQQESFVAVSHTGLSDDEVSINSRYLDKPYHYYGGAEDRQFDNDDHDDGIGQRKRPVQGLGFLASKHTTQTLPRLTMHTRQTKALLMPDEESTTHYTRSHPREQFLPLGKKTSPKSVVIQPETPTTATKTLNTIPMTRDSFGEEFPKSFSNSGTPQIKINILEHDSFQSLSSHPSISSATSSSSRKVETSSSLVDTSFLREKQNAQENKYLESAFREFEYWNETLDKVIHDSGHESLHAARTMMELGACLLRCKQYSQALQVYKNVVTIYKRHHGQNSLSVAKALDRIGFSATLCGADIDTGSGSVGIEDHLHVAEESFKEALRIRIHFLGPVHCDCVDTLNNIAGVYLQRKEYKIAKELYAEVLHVRSKIFGIHHASIAITAQMLGKIHYYFKEFENAMLYYDLALRVYRGTNMNLPDSHPLVRKVKKHVAATEKLMLTKKRVEDCCTVDRLM
mmetsp:Transcript_8917/g.16822  ORF Transcript_8917/g.16822 Transcript_8917/m.16822 type:complete len:539 (+) Transcript_8917:293-1909(+)